MTYHLACQSPTNTVRYFYRGQEVSQSFVDGYCSDGLNLDHVTVVREDDWFWNLWRN